MAESANSLMANAAFKKLAYASNNSSSRFSSYNRADSVGVASLIPLRYKENGSVFILT
jgi:hypothetical protein